jgi:hypothetical protein
LTGAPGNLKGLPAILSPPPSSSKDPLNIIHIIMAKEEIVYIKKFKRQKAKVYTGGLLI